MKLDAMLKKAQEMQTKMQQIQEQLASQEITGEAGAGLVKVTLDGKSYMKRIEIDQELLEDLDMLEDLIVTAYNNAKDKTDKFISEETQKHMGVKLPFEKLPFSF